MLLVPLPLDPLLLYTMKLDESLSITSHIIEEVLYHESSAEKV